MIVKLKDISKSYAEGTDSPRRTILKSFNLSIDFHESISIVGPSGCGKTTLLNILGTLDKPDSGEVLFNDQNVINLTDDQLSILRAQKIGFIFQDPQTSLNPLFKIRDQLIETIQTHSWILPHCETATLVALNES